MNPEKGPGKDQSCDAVPEVMAEESRFNSEAHEIGEIPSSYISTDELAERAGISESTVFIRIASIAPEVFGPILVVKGKNYYSPEQAQMVFDKNKYQLGEVPSDHKTGRDMCLELDITASELRRLIGLIDSIAFGDVLRVREPGARGPGLRAFSPKQQDMLRWQHADSARKRGSVALRETTRKED